MWLAPSLSTAFFKAQVSRVHTYNRETITSLNWGQAQNPHRPQGVAVGLLLLPSEATAINKCSQEPFPWAVWFGALPFQPLHHCWEMWNSPKELLLDVAKWHFCICTMKAHEIPKHLVLVSAELARPPRCNACMGLFCPSDPALLCAAWPLLGSWGTAPAGAWGKSGGCYSSEGSFFIYFFSFFFFFFPSAWQVEMSLLWSRSVVLTLLRAGIGRRGAACKTCPLLGCAW